MLVKNLSSKPTPDYNCEDDFGEFNTSSKSFLTTIAGEEGDKQSEHDDSEGEDMTDKFYIYFDIRHPRNLS